MARQRRPARGGQRQRRDRPALRGLDARSSSKLTNLLTIGGPNAKLRLGGNATAAVSAAAAQRPAPPAWTSLSTSISAAHACILPVPGAIALVGTDRYGSGARSGGKPSYSFMAYGFEHVLGGLLRRLGPLHRVGRGPQQEVRHAQAFGDARPGRRQGGRQARSGRSGTHGPVHRQAWVRGQDRHPGGRRHRDLLGRGPAALRRHLLGGAEDKGRHLQNVPQDGQAITLRDPRGPAWTRTTTRAPAS